MILQTVVLDNVISDGRDTWELNQYSDGTIERFGFCHVISKAL